MQSNILNKLTKASRNYIISTEARIREIDEEKNMIDNLLNGRGVLE